MDAATPDFTPLPHPAAPPIYPAPPAADSDYATSDVMIPMRDGVRLHTVIVTPKNATAPLPILMERTPYGTEGFAASVPRRAKRLGLDGYIHVEQDIRGRFGSEGAFDMNQIGRASCRERG